MGVSKLYIFHTSTEETRQTSDQQIRMPEQYDASKGVYSLPDAVGILSCTSPVVHLIASGGWFGKQGNDNWDSEVGQSDLLPEETTPGFEGRENANEEACLNKLYSQHLKR